MKLKILYEDSNVLVINKPSGISVHKDAHNMEGNTISEYILEEYPKIKNVGESMTIDYKGEKLNIPRPGIVHRLDRETSGALIIAKNQKTFLFLKNQFERHEIKKVYNAFVYGFVSDPKASLLTGKRGVIKVSIGRSPRDIRMWTAGRGAKEPLREAVTEYVVLSRFHDRKSKHNPNDHQFSYLEIYPKTGRTHQIRVHMRYINHPIVSDPLYRGSKNIALGMDRLALHARLITFKLPNGDIKTIEAPFPTDFKKAIVNYLNQ